MSEIDKNTRPETSPMQFADDWKGLFIRGDNALGHFLPAISWVIEKLSPELNPEKIKAGEVSIKEFFHFYALKRLEKLLSDVNQHLTGDDVWPTQYMKNFEDCLLKR